MFVPVSVPSLRRTLSDSARVARCVPGLRQDAGASADPLSGRLRIRVDGHTITYRGALRLTVVPQGGPGGGADSESREGSKGPERPEGPRQGDVLVVGEGVEARGGGSAKLRLTIGLTERDGGTAIRFAGTAAGDGRILDLDPAAALAAAVRLLDRFTQQLVTETLTDETLRDGEAADGAQAGAAGGPVDEGTDGPAAGAEVRPMTGPKAGPEGETLRGIDDAALDEAERTVGEAVEQAIEEGAEEADTTGAATDRPAAAPGSTGDSTGDDDTDGVDDDTPPTHDAAPDEASSAEKPSGTGSVFDTPVPPPSLDPEEEFTVPDGPPVEAAHARRTMIGRSAEEVDHAPPRGRYAPVPSPDTTTAGATLRWVAPAAALALASAVVVGRALRRRR
ncbi:hypothetical protein ACFYYY_00980 [Streptomyces sp. NPDC001834]|uniref:hypothetical protein n=1 Tax=Streptomyces sp. NPDC001834 TaxID=3364616 RepID=UPI00368880F1